MEEYINSLKSDEWVRFGDYETDQRLNKTRPLVQKHVPDGAVLVDLVPPESFKVGDTPLKQVIGNRRSHRYFSDQSLTLEELSFLLWATQGIREASPDGSRFYRNVPSGGNRHPIETYLSIHRVEGVETGLYRYLPLSHQLLVIEISPDIAAKTAPGGMDQTSKQDGETYHFQRDCAVFFIWTATPYRSIWRYGPTAPKMIAIDSGHICQNLYLACGAIGCGTVACAAIDRKTMDAAIGVDGENEFTLYVAPVGKLP